MMADNLVLQQCMMNCINCMNERAYTKGWTYQQFARSKGIERHMKKTEKGKAEMVLPGNDTGLTSIFYRIDRVMVIPGMGNQNSSSMWAVSAFRSQLMMILRLTVRLLFLYQSLPGCPSFH